MTTTAESPPEALTALGAELAGLMKRCAPMMILARETPSEVSLNAPIAHLLKPGTPLWFGGVRVGRRYVSYHLMPIYTHPVLAAQVSPALERRMQGKSCFNFTKPDPALFAQLEALTIEAARLYAPPGI
jgi:hypothetical protein